MEPKSILSDVWFLFYFVGFASLLGVFHRVVAIPAERKRFRKKRSEQELFSGHRTLGLLFRGSQYLFALLFSATLCGYIQAIAPHATLWTSVLIVGACLLVCVLDFFSEYLILTKIDKTKQRKQSRYRVFYLCKGFAFVALMGLLALFVVHLLPSLIP